MLETARARARGRARGTPAWAAALLLAAALFHLRDGRVLEVEHWITHGDEHVVTLADGTSLIVRQQDVREIVPSGQAPRPTPSPGPSSPTRKRPAPR